MEPIPALSPTERAVLLAPDLVARGVARALEDPRRRWLLCQPRDVRRSFCEEVLDRPDDPDAAERWMLLQPEPVRRSYIAEVLS
jgi:hypothetical protein